MFVGERKKIIIVENDGDVITLPKTPYNLLKHKVFEGERIFHQWNDKNYIQETYDDGIFNATLDGQTIQLREENKVANIITEGNIVTYGLLWKGDYITNNKKEIMQGFLKGFGDRVKFYKKGYIVDDNFLVKHDGSAHLLNKEKKIREREKYICIVVKKVLKPYKFNIGKIEIELDEKTQEVMAKIMFLLFPNMSDTVFTNQLPAQLRKAMKDESKVFK